MDSQELALCSLPLTVIGVVLLSSTSHGLWTPQGGQGWGCDHVCPSQALELDLALLQPHCQVDTFVCHLLVTSGLGHSRAALQGGMYTAVSEGLNTLPLVLVLFQDVSTRIRSTTQTPACGRSLQRRYQ